MSSAHPAARALTALALRAPPSLVARASLGDGRARAAVHDGTVRALLDLALELAGPDDAAALGALCESTVGLAVEATEEGLAVRETDGRRTAGAHFTPPDLARDIVASGLAPLLGDAPTSAAILALRVADPAMGAGAFLIAALDVLGRALAAAWTREGAARTLLDAKRAVALDVLYGADKNPAATLVAKRTIARLAGLSPDEARALDGRLVTGDALVGLERAELEVAPIAAARAPTLVADALTGAFFAHRDAAARRRERARRAELLERWAASSVADDAAIRALASDAREALRGASPFHAALAWPPMDAIVGNPPFLGGKRISTELGATYADWLGERHGASKNTDLAAHFLLRARALTSARATISFITTNSLAEGATRKAGLGAMLRDGWRIFGATRSMRWPGEAAVHVSVVHLARGVAVDVSVLDGRPVEAIDSRLRAGAERAEAARLAASTNVCFVGCFLRGKGFVLDAARARALRASAGAASSLLVRPFLGGEEVNTSPTQSPHRFVIDLAAIDAGSCSLEEAERHPALLEHLARAVRPERLALPRAPANEGHRARWWLFANTRPELRRALAPLERCLVVPRVSPRLHVAWQPTDRVFSDQLCVFALDRDGHLAILQSRVHQAWARCHASTLGEGLRYTPSTCVETFPFPFTDPRISSAALDEAGRALCEARARCLAERGVGLTELHHVVSSRRVRDAAIDALVETGHRADRAVLEAYGWDDLALDDAAFDEVIVDRLHALNAARRGTRAHASSGVTTSPCGAHGAARGGSQEVR